MSFSEYVTLAFYKGVGGTKFDRIVDTAIRAATASKYSHVELIVGEAESGQRHRALSSSPRDGGVRSKLIFFDQKKWDFVTVKDAEGAWPIVTTFDGAPYDYAGAILSPLCLPLNLSPKKWFCSEIIAEAIGLKMSWTYSPERLYRTVISLQVDGDAHHEPN